MSSQPPVPPLRPVTGIEPLGAAASVVLRDVSVRGQVALASPRTFALRTPKSEAQRRPDRPSPEPASLAAQGHATMALPTAPVARVDAETLRRGYMEGLAQGRAEAAEEARQAAMRADQAFKKRLQELEAQAQQLRQEQRQKDLAALESQQQRVIALLTAVPAQIQARIDGAEDDLVALCFESVCRILGPAAVTAEGVRAQVAQARKGLQGQLVAVHLHPDDLAMLRAGADNGDAAVQWVADPAVGIGGCILQSQQGGLDARLETQLRTLAELLTQARASAQDVAAGPRTLSP